MEKIDILLWIMGAGFTINFALIRLVWSDMNKRFDRMEEKITDMDRRLCRLEGAFSSKECCILKEERHMKRAE
jgi:hypothetical protein